ncbi:MAG TPA: oligopeptide/dipeptide ABC transporter ATP-binding protein [Candidatus Limnocylindrales bacterium]|nr:oligopeptide/dipeptide ABC transporter ATP-binding protein [Candidatus Limnocylindrales bacterium]
MSSRGPLEGAVKPLTRAWTTADPLMSITDLRVWFPVASGVLQRTVGHVHAVDGVDLDIKVGETVGLVGESGCGKSTLGRTAIRLIEPTAGKITFKGEDITHLHGGPLRALRRDVAMIFQDPYASLDPRQTVGDIVGEPIDVHGLAKGRARQDRIQELLRVVGLNPRFVDRYPHEFSGGQRQRIGIARALAVEPSFIVCDEPISALDVSIQAQIINLLERLQSKFNLTYLFIAHDLSVVKHISNRIAVMYLGKIMEIAPGSQLYKRPRHPYTGSLLSAIPIPDPLVEMGRERTILQGDVASPVNPPSGCRFRTRCPRAKEHCAEEVPPLETFGDEHKAACFYPLD